ncbi:hypothetical protein SDC9_157094 [bioreactor metagenome]|uniref:Uncharacterized protein n=1 Tax=bioreactor metagenome TaxID=1076179 RepID=A0A645F8D5_9ZZZZ
MKLVEFELLKKDFMNADDNKKIEMYVSAEGLTEDQYTQLLRLFPLNKINDLEAALNS